LITDCNIRTAEQEDSASQPEQPHEVEQHDPGFFRVEDQDQSEYYRKEPAQHGDPECNRNFSVLLAFIFFIHE
jgi:hypothetical protein